MMNIVESVFELINPLREYFFKVFKLKTSICLAEIGKLVQGFAISADKIDRHLQKIKATENL